MDRATSRMLIRSLERDAELIARRFGLSYKSIEAERANVTGHYGICYSDGAIRIRLRHAVTGRPLKYSSLVNTLCHELAHLRHFDHSPRFRTFYLRLLEYARAEGIYRPRRPATPVDRRGRAGDLSSAAAAPSRARAREGPEQLRLF
jgi:predicted metal-dependent hydrolase